MNITETILSILLIASVLTNIGAFALIIKYENTLANQVEENLRLIFNNSILTKLNKMLLEWD